MDAIKKNILFTLCIFTRITFVLSTYIVGKRKEIELIIGISSLFFLISFGFGVNFIKNKEIGFFGSKAYWNVSRLFHSTIYLLSGILLLTNASEYAYLILALDPMYGLLLFITHYYS
jgi:hypothetical protein